MALREQLVREQPEDFLYRRDLAQTRLNLGNWYRDAMASGEQAEESIGAPWRSLTLWLAKLRMPPGRGPTCPSRRSFWTPARIRYDLAFTYFNLAVSTLTSDGPPKRPRDLSRRSIT